MNAEFYDFTQQTQGQLFYATRAMQAHLVAELPDMPPLLQVRMGYAESPAWFMLQAAEFDPDPLTLENLRVRDIYASERIVQALLEMLAGERWLERTGDAYHLTEQGREQLQHLRNRAIIPMTPMELPLPQAQIERLVSLLGRIIKLSMESGDQPGTWCLAHSRHRAPATDVTPLLKINQYFSDFNAFRDDAHMAAWKAQDVKGYVWEAFYFVCSAQANSADTVFEALTFRGYSRQEYSEALQALVARNWLTPASDAPGSYDVTDTGRVVQKQVETLTDDYFYAPWSALSEAEIEETKSLLQQFHDKLQALAKSE